LLQQDDVHVPSGLRRTASPSWTAGDVMAATVTSVSDDVTVAQALECLDGADSVLSVIDRDDRLVAAVTRAQLAMAVDEGRSAVPLAAVGLPALVHAHPDHASDIVLERMAQTDGVLPIVSRDNAQKMLGVVTFPLIMRYMQRRGDDTPDAPPRFE
jgi:CBS domain-containing protein